MVKFADELLARRRHQPLPAGVTAHRLRHTFASILYVRAMRRGEGDKERLKALVEGRDWAPLGTERPNAHAEPEPENDETPANAGASEDGRGGFRTCDLSRVKRALSH